MPTDPAQEAAPHTARAPFADPFAWTADGLEARRAAGLLRTLTPRAADCALLDLAGNDYLGLSRHPEVTRAAAQAARRWGAGAGGSRLVTGTTALHTELEAELADFCGFEAALVLSSGYAANLAAVTACTADPAGPGLLVSDARNHASLIDGCRLSRARTAIAAHADPEAVAEELAARPPRESALVVTDSVFSVDGNAAPLETLATVCADAGAGLLVDDAHGLGVLGEGGRGALSAAGLAGSPGTVATVTLSKSLGSQGGAVLGPAHVIAHLVNTARTVIFDTGLAPAAVGAALGALRLLRREPERAARTRAAAAFAYGRLTAAGLDATRPDAAVVAVRAPSPRAAVAWTAALRAVGVQVGCFRPPSVPDGVSRLRLTARGDLTETALAHAVDAVIATAPTGS
ncbi:8-amino-7-oxononanoate synthase [Streptomyces sp. PU-14G]|uniref:8-amino-7-oxononanoate synthase n=1 Tax=Streptomyces sp. PU-14G TaxID=2800808 RepID=UPI0034E0501B